MAKGEGECRQVGEGAREPRRNRGVGSTVSRHAASGGPC